MLLDKLINGMDLELHMLFQRTVSWLLTSGLHVILVVVLAWVAVMLARVVSNRLIKFAVRQNNDVEFQKRIQTLGAIVRYAVTFVIFAITSMMILKEFGIEIGPILAAAGIVGLAVGFGAQSLVKDVISGFFISAADSGFNLSFLTHLVSPALRRLRHAERR